MSDQPSDPRESWNASWDDGSRRLLKATLLATPAQRLAWLEEMLEIAHRTGALERG